MRRMVHEMHMALFGNGKPEAALLSRVAHLERHVKWLLAGIGTVGATLFSQLIGFWAKG